MRDLVKTVSALLAFACGGPETATEADVEDRALPVQSDTAKFDLERGGGLTDPLLHSWQPTLPEPYRRPFCARTWPWDHPWICSRPPCVSGGTTVSGRPINYRQLNGTGALVYYRVFTFPAHLYLAYHMEVADGPVSSWLGISWPNNGRGRSYSTSNTLVLPKGTHRVSVAPLLTRSATAAAIEFIYVMNANGQGRAVVAVTGHDTCE